jgi:hypothetical protein
MSRDASGENLESILASIRRSLSEQVTSVLEEEIVAPAELLPAADAPAADLDAPPVPASLSEQLAVTADARQPAAGTPGEAAAAIAAEPPPAAETTTAAASPARTPILSLVPVPAAALLAAPETLAAADPVAPAPSLAPAAGAGGAPSTVPAPVPPAAEVAPVEAPVAPPAAAPLAPGQKDPLWFLSQPTGSPPPEPKPARPPEPKPSRLGSVRGPLPPFFGSSAEEVVKVEMVPDRPVRSRVDAPLPLTPAAPFPPHLDPRLPPSAQPVDGLRTANGEALRAAHSAGSARTSAIFDPPPADAGTAGGDEAQPPQIQALEAMVADLLRPMLRRWLDENMPRLVSAALKAEAEVMSRRDSGRDPKKP